MNESTFLSLSYIYFALLAVAGAVFLRWKFDPWSKHNTKKSANYIEPAQVELEPPSDIAIRYDTHCDILRTQLTAYIVGLINKEQNNVRYYKRMYHTMKQHIPFGSVDTLTLSNLIVLTDEVFDNVPAGDVRDTLKRNMYYIVNFIATSPCYRIYGKVEINDLYTAIHNAIDYASRAIPIEYKD